MLIVIDEAHNICAPNPATAVERALTKQLVQIAAEGRKFGLCLMWMNSPRDLADLADVFGFAPAELLTQLPSSD